MRRRIIHITLIIFLGMVPSYFNAQSMGVPTDVQITLLPKILASNKSLSPDEDNVVKVGILYNSEIRNSITVKNNIVRGFNNKNDNSNPWSITLIPLDISEIENLQYEMRNNNIRVLYITPIRAYDLEKITQICRKEKIITITGVARYLDYGVSVGFDIINNKLKISVNLESAKEEGANFSSHFLKIANIIY
jgi:hypothetical protein